MSLIRADARQLPIADGVVNCCVTSPPYFGLRDYGHAGQIGMERTHVEFIEALVEVFREVRRVLREDGTCWLNMGDTFNAYNGNAGPSSSISRGRHDAARPDLLRGHGLLCKAMKPKDLLMIPARVALALQQPWYSGAIKDERDRIWLAAMLDAEGCMFIQKRKAGQHNGQGYFRQNDSYSAGVEIANTSLAIIERIMALVGKGSICSQGPEQTNGRRRQTIYRWNLRTNECREFVRELYPHLVGKQQQARILYGCPSSGERAEAAHAGLMSLHRNGASSVDFPELPSMLTPGWYLRSDIIWKKPNPMPESVTDRPTKSHEHLFLLTKSERYWYDAKAIAEPVSDAMLVQLDQEYNSLGLKDYDAAGVQNPSSVKARIIAKARYKAANLPGQSARGYTSREDGTSCGGNGLTRNKRDVWTIPTRPYLGAHFATMPEALVEPCILAGCPVGGLVLDPFIGSGTVGAVAARLGRRWVGTDLNYQHLAAERTAQRGLMFSEATA